jgi:Tfp pilus assembly PilM family ATPase
MKSLLSNGRFQKRTRPSASQLNSIQHFSQQLRKGIDISSTTIEVSTEAKPSGQSIRIEYYPKLWLTTAAPSDNTVTAKQVIGSTAEVAGPERTFDVPTDPEA